ncbi:unnamed protein product, partial [Brugia pahangi]|uniref:AC transposase n=1 Tax=Brugia pahangi TaxID=6280 RepID=A0A0N4T1C3_BRUPA
YGLPEIEGPHKQIVRPETVSIISTHSTRKSYPGYIDVNVSLLRAKINHLVMTLNSSEIVLLHASYKWSETNHSMNDVITLPQLFVDVLASLNSTYYEIVQLLFKNKTMRIDRILQMKIAKWHINKCKSVDLCKAEIVGQTGWIYAENISTNEYQLM